MHDGGGTEVRVGVAGRRYGELRTSDPDRGFHLLRVTGIDPPAAPGGPSIRFARCTRRGATGWRPVPGITDWALCSRAGHVELAVWSPDRNEEVPS